MAAESGGALNVTLLHFLGHIEHSLISFHLGDVTIIQRKHCEAVSVTLPIKNILSVFSSANALIGLGRNVHQAVRLYNDKFPDMVEDRAYTRRLVHKPTKYFYRKDEIGMLAQFTVNPHSSLRMAASEVNISKSTIQRRIVESAAAKAISEFNFGNKLQTGLMEGAKLSPGRQSFKHMKARDKRRIAQSEKRTTIAYNKYLRLLKLKKMKKENKNKEKEGITYGAGLF
ncbi:hypothetical protein J6590_087390 [Homalodisca vitripennis]|nr:hypothetical protein J6590_087390 [Homalodisca vitripennis]